MNNSKTFGVQCSAETKQSADSILEQIKQEVLRSPRATNEEAFAMMLELADRSMNNARLDKTGANAKALESGFDMIRKLFYGLVGTVEMYESQIVEMRTEKEAELQKLRFSLTESEKCKAEAEKKANESREVLKTAQSESAALKELNDELRKSRDKLIDELSNTKDEKERLEKIIKENSNKSAEIQKNN